MNEIFVAAHGAQFQCGEGFLEKLIQASKHIRATRETKHLFFRCKMYFKIRNEKIQHEMKANLKYAQTKQKNLWLNDPANKRKNDQEIAEQKRLKKLKKTLK